MYSLVELLPHEAPMILLSGYDKDGVYIKITNEDIFFDTALNGVPANVGLEYMAQAIALAAGLKDKEDGLEKPKLGFLLGTRHYSVYIDCFEEGKTYNVAANQLFVDEELASFECAIYNQDIKCAEAVLTVFRPKNMEKFR